MSKNLSAKYYQENKEYRKKLVKDEIFLQKKKKKSSNFVVSAISQRMKDKGLLSRQKNVRE